jgi:hypothetical protein
VIKTALEDRYKNIMKKMRFLMNQSFKTIWRWWKQTNNFFNKNWHEVGTFWEPNFKESFRSIKEGIQNKIYSSDEDYTEGLRLKLKYCGEE